MAAIVLDNVTKHYRRYTERAGVNTLKSLFVRDLWKKPKLDPSRTVLALEHVSATINDGSTVGVIGRNGSGKSTLLKLVSRILKPDSGEIRVNGRVAALIELGAGFHPELTGRENILINGIILGLTKAEVRRKMDEIIDFAEVREFIDDPVRTYSSGMYMRLGFSVAVNVDPDILLIDEVLAVGDREFTRKCIARMTAFKRAGKTIVLVTHDVRTVETWCDHTLWLDKGTLMQAGPPAQVCAAYVRSCDEVPPEGAPEGEAPAGAEGSPA